MNQIKRDIQNKKSDLFIEFENKLYGNIMCKCTCIFVSDINKYDIDDKLFIETLCRSLNNLSSNFFYNFTPMIPGHVLYENVYRKIIDIKLNELTLFSAEDKNIFKIYSKYIRYLEHKSEDKIKNFLKSECKFAKLELNLLKNEKSRFPFYNDKKGEEFINNILTRYSGRYLFTSKYVIKDEIKYLIMEKLAYI